MKKALSILLALALAMSLAVCAAAKPETQAAAPAPVLIVELPEVTGLSAVWVGAAPVLGGEPHIGPDTVEITLTYASGGPETLPYWQGEASDGWWNIIREVVSKTATALTLKFYYGDSKLYDAYWDSLPEPKWQNESEEGYRATLQSGTVTIPLTTAEDFLNLFLPWTPLALDEEEAVDLDAGEYKVFTFTPDADGTYCFYSFDNDGDPYGYLVGPDFKIIKRNDDYYDLNFRILAALEEGVTYYLVAGAYAQGAAGYKVIVEESDEDIPYGFALRMNEYVIRYKTYAYIDAWRFIEYNDYEDVLVNGVPLWLWEVVVEGIKTGKVMTLTYTLDGTVLGTVDIVCKMSCAQWVTYYLFFGWAWMPVMRLQPAWRIEYTTSPVWDMLQRIYGYFRKLWFNVL